MIVTADSVTELPSVAGKVLVTGSHVAAGMSVQAAAAAAAAAQKRG
jgi:hypothetical protein